MFAERLGKAFSTARVAVGEVSRLTDGGTDPSRNLVGRSGLSGLRDLPDQPAHQTGVDNQLGEPFGPNDRYARVFDGGGP